MAYRDGVSRLSLAHTVTPQTVTANVTGDTVDMQGADSAALLLAVGTVTDGTYNFDVEESDSSGSGFSSVASDDLVGSFSEVGTSDDDTTQKVSYVGSKRYIRATITASGTSSGALMGILAAKSHLHREPDDFSVDSET